MLLLRRRLQALTALAFSPDGRHLAVGGTGKRADVWHLTAVKPKATLLPPFARGVGWVGFTPAGLVVAASGMARFQLHDSDTGETHTGGDGTGYIDRMVVTSDGTGVLSCGWAARRWAVSPGFPLQWEEANPAPLGREFSRGGCLLTPGQRFIVPVTDGREYTRLHIRDAATGELVEERDFFPAVLDENSLHLSPDGRVVAFLRGQTLHAGLLRQKTFLPVRGPSQHAFRAIAFHPSGKWLACGEYRAPVVRIYETETWREVKAYEWPIGSVSVLAFDADGSRAAAGGAAGTVVVWDVDL